MAVPSRTEIILTRSWDHAGRPDDFHWLWHPLFALWELFAVSRKRSTEPTELEIAPAQAA